MRIGPEVCLMIETVPDPLTVIRVAAARGQDVPAVAEPAPCKVIGLLMVRFDHEQLPAGILIVSPAEAELIAFWISLDEQLEALMVAAWAAAARAQKRKINASRCSSLVMGGGPFSCLVFSNS